MWLVLMASVSIDASFIHVVDACGSDIANAPPTSSASPVVGTRLASSASLVAGTPNHVSALVETFDDGTYRFIRVGAVLCPLLLASALIDVRFSHVVDACGSDNVIDASLLHVADACATDIANALPTSPASPVVGTRRASSASLVAALIGPDFIAFEARRVGLRRVPRHHRGRLLRTTTTVVCASSDRAEDGTRNGQSRRGEKSPGITCQESLVKLRLGNNIVVCLLALECPVALPCGLYVLSSERHGN